MGHVYTVYVKSCWESSGRCPEISLQRDFVSSGSGRCWNLLLVPLKLSLVGEAKFTRCSVEISYAAVLYRDIETAASKKSLNDLTLLSPLRSTFTSLSR